MGRVSPGAASHWGGVDPLEAQRRWRLARPFILLAAFLIAGISLGRLLPVIEWWATCWLVATLAMAVMLWRGRSRAALCWALVAVLAFGGGWYVVRAHHLPAQDIARYVQSERQLAAVAGVVDDSPRVTRTDRGAFARFYHFRRPSTVMTLSVREAKIAGRWERASGRLRVRVPGASPATPIERGASVRVTGWLASIRPARNPGELDLAEIFAREGIHGRLNAASWANVERLDAPVEWRVLSMARSARQWYSDRMLDSLHAGLPDGDLEVRALLDALLLGIRRPELEEAYDAFRRVGLAHLLAISGAHLGILLAMTWGVARLATGRPQAVPWIVLGVLVLYVLALPWRVPIVRASIMAGVFCLGLASGRAMSTVGLVALAAVIALVINPADLFSAGFQLSFAIVAALLLFTRPVGDWIAGLFPARERAELEEVPAGEPVAGKVWDWLRLLLAANVVAFFTALPLIAFHFELISPLAIVMAIVALPLVAALLAVGFVKMVAGVLFPGWGDWLGPALHGLGGWLLGLAEGVSDWPVAAVELAGPASGAWAAAALGVVAATFGGWFAARARVLAICVAVLAGWAAVDAGGLGERVRFWDQRPAIRVNMLAVGHGSCYVVRTADKTFLFDAGSHDSPAAGQWTVVPALRRLGVRELDAVFISHAHMDHYGALLDVADAVPIGRVYGPAHVLDEAAEGGAPGFLVEQLTRRGLAVEPIGRGWRWTDGGTRITAIWPDEDFEGGLNDASLVLRVAAGEARLLLTGDLQAAGIAALLAHTEPGELTAHVMELPHHGEYSDQAKALVEAVDPAIVLQSANERQVEAGRWPPWMAQGGYRLLDTVAHGMVEVAIEHDGSVSWEPYLAQQ